MKSKALLFRDSDQRLQVANYTTGTSGFHPGKPRFWSDLRVMNLANLATYDLAPDGKRLAVIPAVPPGEADKPQNSLVFLLNFTAELQRRAHEAR